MLVKLCCMTNLRDIEWAVSLGANYVGLLVNVKYSPRSLTLTEAKALMRYPSKTVVLTEGERPDEDLKVAKNLKPRALQILGESPPEYVKFLVENAGCEVWKSIFMPSITNQSQLSILHRKALSYAKSGISVLIVDSMLINGNTVRYGGTGKTINWKIASKFFSMLKFKGILKFLAGGINAENLTEAVRTVRPDGIDVCSGVETKIGWKSFRKMKLLINIAKSLEEAA